MAVSAGHYHTGAVRQMVSSCALDSIDVPADLGPILAVSAGRYHTCAMRPDGQLVCFGYSRDGQCDVPADLGPVLAVSTADSIRVQCGQMVSSSALDAMVMDSETCQHIWHQFNEV